MAQAEYRIEYDPATMKLTRDIKHVPSFGGSVTGTEHVHDVPLRPNELRKPAGWQRPTEQDGTYTDEITGEEVPNMVAVPWPYLLLSGEDIVPMEQAQRDAQDQAEADAIAAALAAEAANPTTTLNAFVTLAGNLGAAGYTPVPQHPSDLIGGLPSIVTFIQGKLDAKDAQIAAKQAEIEAHAAANQFRQAFDDQVVFNNLIRQRCQIQDGYNEIQSWALTMLIRRAAGK